MRGNNLEKDWSVRYSDSGLISEKRTERGQMSLTYTTNHESGYVTLNFPLQFSENCQRRVSRLLNKHYNAQVKRVHWIGSNQLRLHVHTQGFLENLYCVVQIAEQWKTKTRIIYQTDKLFNQRA